MIWEKKSPHLQSDKMFYQSGSIYDSSKKQHWIGHEQCFKQPWLYLCNLEVGIQCIEFDACLSRRNTMKFPILLNKLIPHKNWRNNINSPTCNAIQSIKQIINSWFFETFWYFYCKISCYFSLGKNNFILFLGCDQLPLVVSA